MRASTNVTANVPYCCTHTDSRNWSVVWIISYVQNTACMSICIFYLIGCERLIHGMKIITKRLTSSHKARGSFVVVTAKQRKEKRQEKKEEECVCVRNPRVRRRRRHFLQLGSGFGCTGTKVGVPGLFHSLSSIQINKAFQANTRFQFSQAGTGSAIRA